MAEIQKAIESQLLQAAKIVEEKLDEEIEKMERMDEDDLEALRRRRLEELKKQEKLKREWLSKGHGEYDEIAEEKEFFDICKKSENVVCHFYKPSTFRCQIVDKHLSILAKKHIEAKFCKLNVERAPFLTDRLKIRILPTIALCKNGKVKDYIVGFDDLGGIDDFSTDTMAWRIAQAGIIQYHDSAPPPLNVRSQSKIIRGKQNTNDSDDDD
ncbi:thioredoxin domain-containing protein 9 [Centruroides vittatus]|uniref:thioredoxin domain-containing protein 9 n=1 Tax=Centruroides vittatus TaxID=120091 RepID=UPI00350F13B1